MAKLRSAYLRAIEQDNSLPIEMVAVQLWLQDLENPLRWLVRPLLQVFFALLLHGVWLLKRLPLPQFSAHGLLQNLICWFCAYFVRPEANLLILRHFSTESNILNFLIHNSDNGYASESANKLKSVNLYPKTLADLKTDTFVEHDQALFRVFAELGSWQADKYSESQPALNWQDWQPIHMNEFKVEKRWSQCLDFESAHALFMCLFCLLLTREEYRDAINGFNLDQSIAIRISQLINDPLLPEVAYNKYPHYLLGPWNLSQRFLMHGFFTEYLYARLEAERLKT